MQNGGRLQNDGIRLNERNLNVEFIKTFVWRDLAKTLSELGCGDFELGSMADWFWREAQLWSPKGSQAAFNQAARDRLREHVSYVHGFNDATRLATAARLEPKVPEPEPDPKPAPVWKRWERCKHWGGERKCPRCTRPQLIGPMKRAQMLYEDHRGHVLDRLHGELLTYTGGRNPRDNAPFDDLENAVWVRVATNVESFATSPDLAAGGVLAWLSTIVHSVVRDHYKHVFAKRRDVRKETPLPEDDQIKFFWEPVQPTGVGPDGPSDDRDRK